MRPTVPVRLPAGLLAILLYALNACPALAQQNPVTTTFRGTIGGAVLHSTIDGNWGYLARGNSLGIIDRSTEGLQQVGTLPLTGSPSFVAVSGNLAFVAAEETVTVVDVSDRTAPASLGGISITAGGLPVRGLDAAGGRAYVAQSDAFGLDGRVWVIDATGPPAIFPLGRVTLSAQDVDVSDAVASVLATSGELVTYDLSNPGTLTELGRVAAFGGPVDEGRVEAGATHAYAVGRFQGGLAVLDIADPANPALAATVGAGMTYRRLAVHGIRAYAVTDAGRLDIYDVATAAAPTLLASFETGLPGPNALQIIDDGAGKALQNPTAWYTAQQKVTILDVSDPPSTSALGAVEAPVIMLDVATDGQEFFILGGDAVWNYAIENGNEVMRERIPMAGAHLIDADNSRVFLAKGGGDLDVFARGVPGGLDRQSTYRSAAAIRDMQIRGGFGLVLPDAPGSPVVEILDLSDPALPVRSAEVPLDGPGRAVFVSPPGSPAEPYVFAAYESGGAGAIAILDVSNPSAPSVVSTVATLGVPSTLWASGGTLYAGSNSGGGWALEAWNILNPASPDRIGAIDTAAPGFTIGDLFGYAGTVTATFPQDRMLSVFELDPTVGKGALDAFGIAQRAIMFTLGTPGRTTGIEGEETLKLNVLTGGYSSSFPFFVGSSEKERYEIEITRRKYNVMVTGTPVEALQAGCTVSGGGRYAAGDMVTVRATCSGAGGWNVFQWTGYCATKGPTCTFTMPASDVQELHEFRQPILELEAAGVAGQSCPPVQDTQLSPISLTLSANPVDDWLVSQIVLDAEDSPDDPTALRPLLGVIQDAQLLLPSGPALGQLQADGEGRLTAITFGVSETVPAGGAITGTLMLMIAYPEQSSPDFSAACGTDEKTVFRFSATMGKIVANPKTFTHGLKRPSTPFASEPHYVGCVHNVNRGVVFGTMQSAIQSPLTRPGDHLAVCPGKYAESVEVDKRVRLASMQGPDVTWTRPGAAGKAAPTDAFTVTADGTVLQGFHVTSADNGVLVQGASDCTIGVTDAAARQRNVLSTNTTGITVRGPGADRVRILGNYVGTTLNGMAAAGNTGTGVLVDNADDVKIGEIIERWRNVISGNGTAGIRIVRGDSARVIGNYVGVDAAGQAALGNGREDGPHGGVAIEAGSGHVVSYNVVSANGPSGIVVGTNAPGVEILGNTIGSDAGVTERRGNLSHGIVLESPDNEVGGPSAPNVIVANGRYGVLVIGEAATGNLVRYNLVGTNADTVATLGNTADGIRIVVASETQIGGATPDDDDEGNLIYANAGAGVAITGQVAQKNRIRFNSIAENGGLGIDLGADDVTANDLGDGRASTMDTDDGPNTLLNFPVGVTTTRVAGTPVVYLVSGVVDHPTPEALEIDLYASPTVDNNPVGQAQTRFGEGYHYLGTASIEPDKGGVFKAWFSADQLPHPFVSAVAVDAEGNTSEFSPVCDDPDGNGTPDNDGDTLCDGWEANGIDYDGNGTRDLFLGSPPGRPDIFVEVDWMVGPVRSFQPQRGALTDMANAFGRNGISLHTSLDEQVPHVEKVKFGEAGGLDTFTGIKRGVPARPCGGDTATGGHFGSPAERAGPNCAAILGARRLVYHYALFADRLSGDDGTLGIAELPGNDLLLTLGSLSDRGFKLEAGFVGNAPDWMLPRARRLVEAFTFMHELGHNLGLRHGGADDINCKPNYISVMNYALAGRSGVATAQLDYSPRRLVTLNEGNLDETVLLNGGAMARDGLYNISEQAGRRGPNGRFNTARGRISWNGRDSDGDGDPFNDRNVRVDLNYMPEFVCPEAGFQVLQSQNDWTRLQYNFRHSIGFAKGVVPEAVPVDIPEPTADQIEAIATSTDFDGDGHVNADDSCPFFPNADQIDANADGIGDACEGPTNDLIVVTTVTPDPPTQDETVTYWLAVYNAGIDSSAAVVLTDTLDAALASIDVQTSRGSCTLSGHVANCAVGGLAVGDSVLVQISATPATTGLVHNIAVVEGAEPDRNPPNNRHSLTVEVAEATGVETPEHDPDDGRELPDAPRLGDNYPDPFSAATTIPFGLPADSRVTIVVFDVMGNALRRLTDRTWPAGRHKIRFEADDLASGIYFYRIWIGSGFSSTRSMVLSR